MGKKTIFWIAGIMSAALLGIIIIQVYWLNFSITLNETKFDQSVFGALAEVSKQLDKRDKINTPTRDLNRSLLDLSKQTHNMPIEERIDARLLDFLDRSLKIELENRSIKTKFDYGVFNSNSKKFVITNGYYITTLSDNIQADVIKLRDESTSGILKNSKYRTKLFTSAYGSSGELFVFFPGRTRIIWKDVLPTLLFTILSMSIILGAFIYTISTILKQKKISEMKSDFVNNMTHEFKTPIATISLATDSIMNEKIINDKEKISRFIRIIKQENKRMLSQVEKVLQMAQIDKDSLNLKKINLDLNQIVAEAVSNFQLVIQNRGGDLTFEQGATEGNIFGDRTHISNIVHNLLDNANKYSPEAPIISVKTRNIKDGIEIIVKDKGLGMTKEARKHIFEKFYRVHTGNRHDVKGFGLGLSYVKAMTLAHSGQITVDSELGIGSQFTLFLPFGEPN